MPESNPNQPSPEQGGAAPKVEPAGEAKPEIQAPARPEGIDESYWDSTANTFKVDTLKTDLAALKELKAFKAEADIKAQGVPAKPEEYKIALDGWKAPEGVEVAIDEKHPLAAPAKAFLHKWGGSQEQMNDLVRMHADFVAAEAAEWNKMLAAEHEKLGAKAQDRIAAVTTALTSRFGEKAKSAVNVLVNANVVEIMESLLRSTQAPGPAPNGKSEPKIDLSKMTPDEKFAYHLSRSQPQAARN